MGGLGQPGTLSGADRSSDVQRVDDSAVCLFRLPGEPRLGKRRSRQALGILVHPDSGTHSLEMETLTSTLYVKCPQSVGTLKKSCATAGPENSGEM